MSVYRRTGIAVAAVAGSMLFSACAGGAAQESNTSGSKQSASSKQSEQSEQQSKSGGSDPMANLVGPACDDYAKQVPEGAGSVQGMAQDPVAVAASNNPMLETLTQAVSGKLNPKVDLVDTLNGGEFTVFAPVDEAFGKLPKSTVKQLSQPENADALTSVLTYHVVQGQLSPQEVTGKQKTVQGDTVEVSGSGDNLKVDDASVICGGVQTDNATVYLIDNVLMPSSMS